MSRAYTFEAVSERLSREPKPLRSVASRLLWKSGLCRAFTIPRPGYRLRFYPSAYSSLLWLDPAGCQQDEQVLRDILRPGDSVVDVGANIGTLALCAASVVGDTGHVYALEAHPRTFRFLSGNLELNNARNVEPIHVAVGDTSGQILLTDSTVDDQNGITKTHGIPVRMKTLGALLPGRFPVRLLKIDVEGYELPVLRGAPELLARTAFVYLECWDKHVARYGFRLADVVQLLSNAGFEIFRFSGKHRLVRVRERESFPVCENVLAVRDWRLAQEETGLEFEESDDTTSVSASCNHCH